jgi:prolyl oligopeptidase
VGRYAAVGALVAVVATACGSTRTAPEPGLPVDNPAADPVAPEPTAAAKTGFVYPAARRGDVVDTYHGVEVADPYRWLEDPDSPESRAWIVAQNELTFGYLEGIAQRAELRRRIETRWNYERYGTPFEKGGRYFFTKNDGLQDQSVLYWAPSLDAEPSVLLDPNTWSKDGTVALAGYSVSDDGRYIAYGVQTSGSDWRKWRVAEIATGKVLDDVLDWLKFSGVSWDAKSKGFYYSRYPAPADGESLTGVNQGQRIYYHALGKPQSSDVLIHERPDQPKWFVGAFLTEDQRYLVLITRKGTGNLNLVHVRDERRPRRGFVPVIAEWQNDFTYVGNDGPKFYFFTDADATRGRVVAIDIRRPDKKRWKEIIGQRAETLRSASIVGDRLFAGYLVDAKSAVFVHDLRGKKVGEVKLPGMGTAYGFGGERSDTETFYQFTSFTDPGGIYRYDLKTGKSSLYREPEVDFDGEKYITEQRFFKSKDGTRIPMFVVHKKGLVKDGKNPTLLYGYGGFNASMTPGFSITKSVWLELGGVYALVNLRGGGEYGEQWHQAGIKLAKQNVFDDFIAAAEHLIAERYTSPKKLAIQGRSNGGLLVGAVMNQRPELFAAALPGVGVMDMLRFHKFTIGYAWVDDYGSSDDPEEFKALRAYSPLHNLKPGVRYPSTLITTADHDDRVVPGHSFKFAATLQHAHRGDNPVLIRIETKAGHGAGMPTKMRIDQAADEWAFLVKELGIEL